MENTLGIFGFLCAGLFLFAFGAGGVYLIVRGLKNRKQAAQSQNWPSVPGMVVESAVRQVNSQDAEGDTDIRYAPQVVYEYTVDAHPYRSSQMSFGPTQTHQRRTDAEAIMQRYPVGAAVAVYYDPQNPGQAVLERSAAGNSAMFIIGIALLAVDVCLFCPGVLLLILNFAGGTQ